MLEKSSTVGMRNVTLRWASGAEKKYTIEGIGGSCYERARNGSQAEMVTWRGKLMRFEVRGATCQVTPQEDGALMLTVAPGWAGAGLVLACLLLPAPLLAKSPGLRFGAWMGLGGLAYFPVIQLITGETQWWVWALCVPLMLMCSFAVLFPPDRRVPRYAGI
ncbi:hypothetical protein DSC45_17095 [Streptomyces sp. YIM 130001]|uniref:hypothetical protein n=1 Tax=Streptomyces sp. YIM 130001 TaxID=2259644 RepID=UPI000E649444|nr:hypothetical protein [Streptomyces sp. YIM 130001]RII15960.1 hypothetical protein DSC45_17095 [Streptomyces sp. YIM 130001]